MRYYKFCFSPTGGTQKVADAIADGWGEVFQPVDWMQPTGHMHFRSDDVCLFAVPSYGGRIPTVVVDRLQELAGNGARAVLVAVYGNRAIDDTLLELSDELQKAGFHPVAGIEAVAQHSLLPQFGAGRPDGDDLAALQGYGRQLREALAAGQLNESPALPGNRPYREYKGVPLKPSVAGGCIGCGICADECPVGAIPQLNYRTTDTRKCISCMHCVAVCPKQVRHISKLMSFAAAQRMKKTCYDRKENKLYL